MAIIKCTYLTEICGNNDCDFYNQKCNYDEFGCAKYTDSCKKDEMLIFFEHCTHAEYAEQHFIAGRSYWMLDEKELNIGDMCCDRDSIAYLAINGEVIINREEDNNGK